MGNSNKKTTIIVLISLLVFVSSVAVYKVNKVNLVDKSAYRTFAKELTDASTKFRSNEEYRVYLEKWAAANGLLSTTDSAGNIIVRKNASKGFESRPTTIVCTDYNYKTAAQEQNALVSAQCIAASDSKSGPVAVLFLNNENNEHGGAKNFPGGLLGKDTHVLYLDCGQPNRSSHISVSSFAAATSDVQIPYAAAARTCDTAIKISLSGLPTGKPDSATSSQPSPISVLSRLLSRFRNKSMTFEIADLKIGNEGNMPPTSLEMTLLINSYDLEDVSTYLDEKIEEFKDDYGKDYPEAVYRYEVQPETAALPEQVYDSKTTDALNTFLYTIKNGNYRFDEKNVPEGREKDEVYGFNCIEQLYVEGSTLHLQMHTAAMNDERLDQLLTENGNAASLSDVGFSTTDLTSAFAGTDKGLAEELSDTYTSVNGVALKSITLPLKEDKRFTACSLLAALQPEAHIVHLSLADDERSGLYLTNTILNQLSPRHGSALLNL